MNNIVEISTISYNGPKVMISLHHYNIIIHDHVIHLATVCRALPWPPYNLNRDRPLLHIALSRQLSVVTPLWVSGSVNVTLNWWTAFWADLSNKDSQLKQKRLNDPCGLIWSVKRLSLHVIGKIVLKAIFSYRIPNLTWYEHVCSVKHLKQPENNVIVSGGKD